MQTLYVGKTGAVVRRTGDRLIVEGEGGSTARSVRLRDLERVVLLGNVGMTAGAMTALLEAAVGVSIIGRDGQPLGALVPAESKDVFLRREQFAGLSDEPHRLRVARRIVSGKIRNARRVIQRHLRNHPDAPIHDATAALQSARLAALRAKSLPALLGVEGDAARVYFGAFAPMMRADLVFTGRNRRPPRDPVNALLSFGYTLLCGEAVSALAGIGLDPYVGVLHELDYGRASLALDLLEEFRHPVVDRLVLRLVNRRELTKEDFLETDGEGVRLTDSGRSRFLASYAECIESAPDTKFESVRAVMRRQALRLREAIRRRGDYSPWRYV